MTGYAVKLITSLSFCEGLKGEERSLIEINLGLQPHIRVLDSQTYVKVIFVTL